MLLYEFKADLNAYLRRAADVAPVHSLADLIAFNEREKAREMPYFGQEMFAVGAEEGPARPTPAYRDGAGDVPRAGARAGHRRA